MVDLRGFCGTCLAGLDAGAGLLERTASGLWRLVLPPLAVFGCAGALTLSAAAQDASPNAVSGEVRIELNKTEQTDKGCRFYWLVSNKSDAQIEKLDLAFYWFRSDGVIGGDLKFGFAPAPAKKMMVKQYILPGQSCDDFASLLVNEVSACESEAGPIENCAGQLQYASRAKVEFLQ